MKTSTIQQQTIYPYKFSQMKQYFRLLLLFFFFLMTRHPPKSTLFPSTPLSRSGTPGGERDGVGAPGIVELHGCAPDPPVPAGALARVDAARDAPDPAAARRHFRARRLEP